MTLEALRDEFAAAALPSIISGIIRGIVRGAIQWPNDPASAAEAAYRYADAMLFERRVNCPQCGRLQPPEYLHTSGCTYGYQIEGDAPVGT